MEIAKIDGVSFFPPKPKRPMIYCEPDSLSDYFKFDESLREDMHSLFKVAKDLGKDIKTWDDLKYYCMFVRMNKSVQKTYLLFEESLRKIENSMIVSRGYYLDFPFESEELLEDINQGNQSEDGINGVVTGEEFEQYCAKLLTSNGYENVELTPGSGDHGVDITAEKDYVTYAIQCKFYSSPVGNSAVQEVFSGKKIYGKDIAVVMTNNVFTSQAIDDAKQLGVKLWDKDILEKMSNV